MRPLAEYRAKRDFSKTREPTGNKQRDQGNTYVIQKHAARKLHFDFRLEWKGVLKSWAVPRGPSLDPADKRLAVEVEDHPLEYAGFEGTIPKGEYGGGTVMVWDEGSWIPQGDVEEGLKKGHLDFVLQGQRLKGVFHLLRLRDGKARRANWLLIKGKDKFAKPGDGDWAIRQTRSIKTKRQMEDIAKAKDAFWSSPATKQRDPSSFPEREAPRKIVSEFGKGKTGEKGPLPPFIAPQLASRRDQAPSATEWVHEIKYDGYRIGVRIDHKGRRGKVRLLTRSGLDWSKKFAHLVAELAKLKCASAYLDGEVVALDEQNISHFASLQEALSLGKDDHLKCYFFDLLYLDGYDLRSLPLTERKRKLKQLLGGRKWPRLFYSDDFQTDGTLFFKSACNLSLEGVVSKRKSAPYVSGRTGSWIKTKCLDQEEYIIGGYTKSKTGRGIGSILVGHYEGNALIYDGRSGTGFSQKLAEDLERRLRALAVPKAPFSEMRAIDRRKAQWVRPLLVAQIKHSGRSSDGLLRAASFIALREDKPSSQVTGDIAMPSKRKGESEIEGVTITHPGRVIDPLSGATKWDLAKYYKKVAPLMLPEIVNRPLSVIRCPEGIEGQKFFQRHPQASLRQASHFVDPKDGERLIVIQDAKELIGLVQMGIVEIHPWPCRIDDIEHADRMIFDLDPDPSVEFSTVIKAAFDLRDRLKEMGMISLAKITGGKGVHVVLPLRPAMEWVGLKEIAKAIATQIAREEPTRFTMNMSKTKRLGKIFIDYLRNERTATAIGNFSARARPGLPIAVPLNWRQLRTNLKRGPFSIRAKNFQMPEEWQEIDAIKQRFKAKTLRDLGLRD